MIQLDIRSRTKNPTPTQPKNSDSATLLVTYIPSNAHFSKIAGCW